MKVAVTGASGYLGRVLLPILEASDFIERIVAIDVASPPESEKVTFSRRDVRNPEIVEDFKGCDAVVHLAFIVMPIRSEKETDAINIRGSRNVFTQAAAAGVKKIVHLSSVAAYGAWRDNPDPIYEDAPLRPMRQFYYSRTKGAVEFWLDQFERQHRDINIVRLRPCIFVGPKINNMMVELVNRKKLPVFPGYNAQIQFVWDEDVAKAIMLSLAKDVRGAFNIAGDNPLTMRDLAQLFGADTVWLPYPIAYWSAKIIWALHLHQYSHSGWLEVARYSINANCDKAKRELGWSASLDSAGAIKRFIKEYSP